MNEQDLEDALDALELMAGQYLHEHDGLLDHDFMSAGEYACEVLARLRPKTWRLIPTGLARVGEADLSPSVESREYTPSEQRALLRIVDRWEAPRLPPDAGFSVSYLLGPVADVERIEGLGWAVDSVHHWLAMGARWVGVHRRDVTGR